MTSFTLISSFTTSNKPSGNFEKPSSNAIINDFNGCRALIPDSALAVLAALVIDNNNDIFSSNSKRINLSFGSGKICICIDIKPLLSKFFSRF